MNKLGFAMTAIGLFTLAACEAPGDGTDNTADNAMMMNDMDDDMMANDMMSNDMMANDMMSNDMMANDMMANDMMSNDMMANDMMANDSEPMMNSSESMDR